MHATVHRLTETDFPPIRRATLKTLQVNLGYRCNQSCLHCHVNAGPNRRESMDRDTVELVLQVLADQGIGRLDLTGGAPELHPRFRYLLREAVALGVQVIDRCNLTILSEPGQQDLAAFLADQGVEIVASLPCYLEENVDAQRGSGVFQASMAGLRALNELGYGVPGSGLLLNLVYNPQGATLPPAQRPLERSYQDQLWQRFGIQFNQLYVLTNMPIQRFGSTLISHGEFDEYMQLLKASHCADHLAGVMCRELISVDWRGYVYDCDFNQMLDLPLGANGTRLHLRELDARNLEQAPIRVGEHCYGCTAGQGSSCGGALD